MAVRWNSLEYSTTPNNKRRDIKQKDSETHEPAPRGVEKASITIIKISASILAVLYFAEGSGAKGHGISVEWHQFVKQCAIWICVTATVPYFIARTLSRASHRTKDAGGVKGAFDRVREEHVGQDAEQRMLITPPSRGEVAHRQGRDGWLEVWMIRVVSTVGISCGIVEESLLIKKHGIASSDRFCLILYFSHHSYRTFWTFADKDQGKVEGPSDILFLGRLPPRVSGKFTAILPTRLPKGSKGTSVQGLQLGGTNPYFSVSVEGTEKLTETGQLGLFRILVIFLFYVNQDNGMLGNSSFEHLHLDTVVEKKKRFHFIDSLRRLHLW
eukprot:jgi/Picre1/34210/NNA_001684.t1